MTRDLYGLFRRLRERELDLGLGELLDAERLLTRTPPPDEAEVARLLPLLWCKSAADREAFAEVWGWRPGPGAADPAVPAPDVVDQNTQDAGAAEAAGPDGRTGPRPAATPALPSGEGAPLPLEPQPFRAEPPAEPRRSGPALHPYWPVTRREMGYAWARLRRPVADGPWTRLDLPATVARSAREGIYRGPVYARETRNHAHLVLLVDRRGSMVPFHPLARDLVETARAGRSLERVDVYYFQNWIGELLFRDPYLVEAIPVQRVLPTLAPETRVLIVSDGGAARGRRRSERIGGMRRFLRELRARSRHTVWVNPLPIARWEGSSAEILAREAPMFPLDRDGLLRAVRVLAGGTEPDR